MKTVCYFGIYNQTYSRYHILKRGLEENGVHMIECHSSKTGFNKFVDLIKKHWVLRNQYDVMIVGYPGQRVMLLAKLLSKKKIIFDAFISVYDTRIFDRTYDTPGSLRSIFYWLQDWISCWLADEILLDTWAHVDYFVKTFNIPLKKFQRVLVGSDDSVIYPQEQEHPTNRFVVHFHGTFIPLHGIQFIIQAAKLLEGTSVHFNILGSGQTRNVMLQLAKTLEVKNVSFLDPVPYECLNNYLNQSDMCLGIFGDTRKAKRVIPNKIYEALAARRPCLTGDSKAIRELLTDRENVLLCTMADPEDLAKKILELQASDELRHFIANNGYKLFMEKLQPKMLTQCLYADIQKLSA